MKNTANKMDLDIAYENANLCAIKVISAIVEQLIVGKTITIDGRVIKLERMYETEDIFEHNEAIFDAINPCDNLDHLELVLQKGGWGILA